MYWLGHKTVPVWDGDPSVYREVVVSRVLQERPARKDFDRLCVLVRQPVPAEAPVRVAAGPMGSSDKNDGLTVSRAGNFAWHWIDEYVGPAHGLKIDVWSLLPVLLQRAANSEGLVGMADALGVKEERLVLTFHTDAALMEKGELRSLWSEVVFGSGSSAKRARRKLRGHGVRGKQVAKIEKAANAWYNIRIMGRTQAEYGKEVRLDEPHIRMLIYPLDNALGLKRRKGRPPKPD